MLNTDLSDALLHCGIFSKLRKKLKEAEELLLKAVSVKPSSLVAYIELANLYSEMKDKGAEQSLKMFDEVCTSLLHMSCFSLIMPLL